MREYDEEEVRRPSRKKVSAKALRRKKRRRKRIAILCVELVLLLMVMACVFVLSKWDLIVKNRINAQINQDIDKEVEASMSGYTTYALFGVDARDVSHLDKGTHGDVVMICSINNQTGEIRLASIYRDTLLAIDEKTNKLGKMTTAYYNGGAEGAVNTLNRCFDLTIEDYATVNWAAVATAVNDLGGVTVNITDEMLSYKNQINGYIQSIVEATGIPSTQIKKTGPQLVDGVQAVAYCRIRYKAGNDFGRTERQREVISQLFEKAKSNVLALNKVVDDVLPNCMTSLQETEVLGLAGKLGKLHMAADGTSGFPREGTYEAIKYNGGDTLAPNSLVDVARELHQFLYGTEKYNPSPTVQKISSLIGSKIK